MSGWRPTCERLVIAILLGMMTTLGMAWGLACADIPGVAMSSGQRIWPQRGEVGHAETDNDSMTGRIYRATGRVSVRVACFGPNFVRLPGLPLITSPVMTATPTTPPDELAPASVRAMAAPWLAGGGVAWPRGADSDWREVEASGWPLLALATVKG